MRFECAYHGEIPRLYADGSSLSEALGDVEESILHNLRFVIESPQGEELSVGMVSIEDRPSSEVPANLFEKIVDSVNSQEAEQLGLECPECGERNELVAVVDIK